MGGSPLLSPQPVWLMALRAEGDSSTAQGEVLLFVPYVVLKHPPCECCQYVCLQASHGRRPLAQASVQPPTSKALPRKHRSESITQAGREKTKHNKGRFQDLIWDSTALSHVVFTTAEILPGC